MLLKQEQAAQEKKSWAGGQYIEEHQGRWQIYVTWGNRNACSASGRGEADSCINGTRVPIRGKWGSVLWAHSPVLGLLCYGFGSPRMRLWVHSRVGESRVVLLKSWNQQMLGPELYASGTQDSASWWRVSPDGLYEGYGGSNTPHPWWALWGESSSQVWQAKRRKGKRQQQGQNITFMHVS